MPSHQDKTRQERIRKHRETINRYNIIFEGPIPASAWPAPYAPIFQRVRDIEDVKYEQYIRINGARSQYPCSIVERVRRLIRDAYDCRNQGAEEATWREKTEHSILERFNLDVFCWVCKERLWIADFQVWPSCPDAAAQLEEKRARQRLCACHPGERGIQKPERPLQQIFQSRGNAAVVDDTVPEIKNRVIPQRKPDNVIGLRHTKFFEDLLPSLPDLRHCPFDRGSPSFPFLILEAKSETGSVGFESIERQTAFPIRTLVNIQKGLQDSTCASNFYPLVWFLANQGEEWRVYACIAEGVKIRVIDLWHGTILRDDHALQLFLIIDLISDWARDIYRKGVRRLVASSILPRDVTPAESNISYALDSDDESVIQNNFENEASSTASDKDEKSSPDANSADYMDQSMIMDEGSWSADEMEDVMQMEASRGSSLRINPGNSGVAQNANDVLVSYRHLAIPESEQEIIYILQTLEMGNTVQVARRLFELISPSQPEWMDEGVIEALKQQVTGHTTSESTTAEGGRIPVLAYISFDCFFREHDWQMVHQVSCITASYTAVCILASLGKVDGVLPTPMELSPRGDVSQTVRIPPIHLLAGEESAFAGVSNLHLQLGQKGHALSGVSEYQWLESESRQARISYNVWRALETNLTAPGMNRYLYSFGAARVMSVRQYSLPHLKFGRKTQAIGALLVKKRASWPKETPPYCLVVFDNADVCDSNVVAGKIAMALWSKSLYQETGHGIAELDRLAIQMWAAELTGV